MSERFFDTGDDTSFVEITTANISEDLSVVNHGRSVVRGVAGCIDAEVVNQYLQMIQHELGPNSLVDDRIEMLKEYILVVERRLAVLDNRRNTIEQRMIVPQKVVGWAGVVLAEIEERKTNIAQQIQDLQKQKNSAENREKINKLEQDKNYSDAALHHRAWDARINANADLKRLNRALTDIDASKSVCFESLRQYHAAIQELSDRVEKVSTALGGLVSSMTEIKTVAVNQYNGVRLSPPELFTEVEIDTMTGLVSYGDHPSFTMDDHTSYHPSTPDHPANILEFSDAVSVEMTVESVSLEEVEQPDSLEPLLREKVLEAQSIPRSTKKSSRIKNLLKSNKLRV